MALNGPARAGRGARPWPIPLPALLNALPDLALAAAFLVTWLAPGTFGHGIVNGLLMMLLMELVVIQASGFMGSVALARVNRAERAAAVLAFAGFYTVFAAAVSIGFRSWWPVATFWGLSLNRLFGVVVGQVPSEDQVRFVKDGWAAAMVMYMLACFAPLVISLPPLGLTPTAMAAQRVVGVALWAAHPEKLMAFGLLYYAGTGCSELWSHRWTRPLRRAAPQYWNR